MFSRFFWPERFLPKRFSCPIKSQHTIQTVDRRGYINVLVPHDGRGAAFARERRFPKDVGGIPVHRICPLECAAIVVQTAPPRPVGWSGNRAENDHEQEQERQATNHLRSLSSDRSGAQSHLVTHSWFDFKPTNRCSASLPASDFGKRNPKWPAFSKLMRFTVSPLDFASLM